MSTLFLRIGWLRRLLCAVLAASVGLFPMTAAIAQTNGAAMAVRQAVEGITGDAGPEGTATPQPQPAPGQAPSSSPDSSAVKIDTRFIAPNAAAVIVMRPAQLFASPVGQLLPAELVTAYLGFNPTDIDEVTAFVDPSNITAIGYGVTLKFKNPIRATSIPVERRSHVQLAELGGKKYLRNASPSSMMYSLYGPNNKTLVAATETALRQLVDSAGQPKSGPMIERLREVPAGSDLYVAVDVAALRPYLAMGLPMMQSGAPAEAKQFFEVPNLVASMELTLNVSAAAPTSWVLHCNDEAAAQKLELMTQGIKQKYQAAANTQQPGNETPTEQAMKKYFERLSAPFQLQRNGANITLINLDGQDPAQRQMATLGFAGLTLAALSFGSKSVPLPIGPQSFGPNPEGAPFAVPGVAPGSPGAPPGVPGAPPGVPGAAPGVPGSTTPEPERR